MEKHKYLFRINGRRLNISLVLVTRLQSPFAEKLRVCEAAGHVLVVEIQQQMSAANTTFQYTEPLINVWAL